MKKPLKIILGVLAGVYAVAQAVRLVVLLTSTAPAPRGQDAQAFAAGNVMGSVLGLSIGGVVCLLLLRNAFRASTVSGGSRVAGRYRHPVGRDTGEAGAGDRPNAEPGAAPDTAG